MLKFKDEEFRERVLCLLTAWVSTLKKPSCCDDDINIRKMIDEMGNDVDKYKELLSKGVQILSLIVFPIMAGILVLAPTVVGLLFGDAFMPTATTLRIFAVMTVVLPFGNLLCYQVLIVSKKEKIMIPVYAIAAVTNVALNMLLIRTFIENPLTKNAFLYYMLHNIIHLHPVHNIMEF